MSSRRFDSVTTVGNDLGADAAGVEALLLEPATLCANRTLRKAKSSGLEVSNNAICHAASIVRPLLASPIQTRAGEAKAFFRRTPMARDLDELAVDLDARIRKGHRAVRHHNAEKQYSIPTARAWAQHGVFLVGRDAVFKRHGRQLDSIPLSLPWPLRLPRSP